MRLQSIYIYIYIYGGHTHHQMLCVFFGLAEEQSWVFGVGGEREEEEEENFLSLLERE